MTSYLVHKSYELFLTMKKSKLWLVNSLIIILHYDKQNNKIFAIFVANLIKL